MKPKTGIIDSLNFSSSHLEDYFISDDYLIVPVKGIGIFEPNLWRSEFNKPLTRNVVEAKILYVNSGISLPIKTYAIRPSKQTLEFAGLQGYNDRSKLLGGLLSDLYEHIQNEQLTRIDVAIDFKKVPSQVIKSLERNRIPFRWKNTTYNKTTKEKKTNNTLDIKIYNKALKENLDYPLERLEFSFKGQYLNKMKICEIEKTYLKMQKTIKRFSGLEVEINRLR